MKLNTICVKFEQKI